MPSPWLFTPGDKGGVNRRLDLLSDTANSTRLSLAVGATTQKGSAGQGIVVPKPKFSLAQLAQPLKGALQPGSDVSTNADALFTITYGTYGGAIPTISGTPLSPNVTLNIITLAPTDEVVYMQCDFTFDTSSGDITITDAEIHSAALTDYEALTNSISTGTATIYQSIFGVAITAPVGSGPYMVIAAPGLSGSQNFNICSQSSATPGLNGPWLV